MPLLIEEALDYAKLLRCVAGREENNALIEKADMIKQKAHALARRNNMDPSDIQRFPDEEFIAKAKTFEGYRLKADDGKEFILTYTVMADTNTLTVEISDPSREYSQKIAYIKIINPASEEHPIVEKFFYYNDLEKEYSSSHGGSYDGIGTTLLYCAKAVLQDRGHACLRIKQPMASAVGYYLSTGALKTEDGRLFYDLLSPDPRHQIPKPDIRHTVTALDVAGVVVELMASGIKYEKDGVSLKDIGLPGAVTEGNIAEKLNITPQALRDLGIKASDAALLEGLLLANPCFGGEADETEASPHKGDDTPSGHAVRRTRLEEALGISVQDVDYFLDLFRKYCAEDKNLIHLLSDAGLDMSKLGDPSVHLPEDVCEAVADRLLSFITVKDGAGALGFSYDHGSFCVRELFRDRGLKTASCFSLSPFYSILANRLGIESGYYVTHNHLYSCVRLHGRDYLIDTVENIRIELSEALNSARYRNIKTADDDLIAYTSLLRFYRREGHAEKAEKVLREIPGKYLEKGRRMFYSSMLLQTPISYLPNMKPTPQRAWNYWKRRQRHTTT